MALRSRDYFNSVISINENIYHLLNSSQKVQTIRININIIQNMFKSYNIDKVRLILDSRVVLYLLNYANSKDVRIRESVLDIFLMISNSFRKNLKFI